MMYDQERARQPQSKSPAPAKRYASQPPGTEPAHAPHEPPTDADDLTTPGTPDPALLPWGQQDELAMRLRQALNTFVDSPHRAVEEADSVFADAITHLTEALAERRRVLRAGWQGQDTEAQTEELQLALRQYRMNTELLLRM
ncbi:hypothetical protein ACIRO1_07275 [Streptomyces sp. NPDC102381]|uniref:hypothetical protein n=1 Tax=Streptomyces sp. NPDC102381 TaxID=3366164 RepID=UPI00380650DC